MSCERRRDRLVSATLPRSAGFDLAVWILRELSRIENLVSPLHSAAVDRAVRPAPRSARRASSAFSIVVLPNPLPADQHNLSRSG